MNENTVSLEILLLNDLLDTQVIDKAIFDKAVKKIHTNIKPLPESDNTLRASA